MKKPGLSKDQIVAIAKSSGQFGVLIYHYRHDNLRKKVRQLCKDGILKYKETVHKTKYYEFVEGVGK